MISGVEFNQFESAVKQIKETENIEVRLSTPRSRIRNAENSMFPATKALQGGTLNDSFQRTVTLSFGGGQSVSPERIKQLAQPKHEYEPADIYKHQEFRGMIHADYQDAVVTVLNGGSKKSKYDTGYNSQIINFRNSNSSFKSPTTAQTMKTPRGELTQEDIPKIPLMNSDYTDATTPILNEDQQHTGAFSSKSSHFGPSLSLFTSPRNPQAPNLSAFTSPTNIMSKRRKAQTGSSRTNTLLSMSNLKQFAVDEETQVKKDMQEMNQIEQVAEKVSESTSVRRDSNKYPNNQL